ncbi:MAG: HEAT repeat domain-containing protein [Cyanobacteria bacterium J06573_11]
MPSMDISEIKRLLADEDPKLRLRGLVALKDYDSEAAVPLLINQRQDDAFLVRSFVAMGLGRKQNEAAYSALMEMLPTEPDKNVKAEISNSLGLYGARSVDTLVSLFYDEQNWLVRRSILAIMPEMDCPQQLLEIALAALKDDDETIVQAGVATLGMLAGTAQADAALAAMIPLQSDKSWRLRMYLAYALKSFESEKATTTLTQLRQDSHHKVVAAALEALLPT